MRLLLQAMTSHVKLPVKKLQDSFASLGSETTKALGRDVIKRCCRSCGLLRHVAKCRLNSNKSGFSARN